MRQSSGDVETWVRGDGLELFVLKRTMVGDLGDGWAEGSGLLGLVCLIASWLCRNISVPGTNHRRSKVIGRDVPVRLSGKAGKSKRYTWNATDWLGYRAKAELAQFLRQVRRLISLKAQSVVHPS